MISTKKNLLGAIIKNRIESIEVNSGRKLDDFKIVEHSVEEKIMESLEPQSQNDLNNSAPVKIKMKINSQRLKGVLQANSRIKTLKEGTKSQKTSTSSNIISFKEDQSQEARISNDKKITESFKGDQSQRARIFNKNDQNLITASNGESQRVNSKNNGKNPTKSKPINPKKNNLLEKKNLEEIIEIFK